MDGVWRLRVWVWFKSASFGVGLCHGLELLAGYECFGPLGWIDQKLADITHGRSLSFTTNV
jgi:hypothetical protein